MYTPMKYPKVNEDAQFLVDYAGLRQQFYDLVQFYTRHDLMNKAGKVIDLPTGFSHTYQLFAYQDKDNVNSVTLPVKEYVDYLEVHNLALTGEKPDWEAQTRNLALMAVGAYNALVGETVRTYEGLAAITTLTKDTLKFIVTANDQPSIIDPAGFTAGWVAYRLYFAGGRMPQF